MMAHVNGNEGDGESVGERENGAGDRPETRQRHGRSHRPFAMEIETLPFVNRRGEAAAEDMDGSPRELPEWSPATQPKPIGIILNHVHTGDRWVASITREWADPEEAETLCGYCPKDQCQLTERGTCNVQAVTLITSKELAGTFARPGSPAAIANAAITNAAIAAATGLPLVPGGEDVPR